MDAAYNIINHYLALKDETLVIFYDSSTKLIVEKIKKDAFRKTQKIFLLNLDDIRPIKLFPDSATELMLKADASIFAARSLDGELITFRRPLRMLAHQYKIRHVHMPNLTKEIMETGLNVDADKLWSFSRKAFDSVKDAKKIRVATASGTDYTAAFGKYGWVDQNGDFTRYDPKQINLPGAEVLTCPADSHGKVVVDGLIGDYFAEKYGVLKEPVFLEIKDNKIIKLDTKNKKLKHELDEYLKTDQNSNKIGEFALGTNIFLKKLTGIMLQDEKFPGIHIAAGNPYPEKTKADWTSRTHVDFLVLKPNVEVDGKLIMKEGKYII